MRRLSHVEIKAHMGTGRQGSARASCGSLVGLRHVVRTEQRPRSSLPSSEQPEFRAAVLVPAMLMSINGRRVLGEQDDGIQPQLKLGPFQSPVAQRSTPAHARYGPGLPTASMYVRSVGGRRRPGGVTTLKSVRARGVRPSQTTGTTKVPEGTAYGTAASDRHPRGPNRGRVWQHAVGLGSHGCPRAAGVRPRTASRRPCFGGSRPPCQTCIVLPQKRSADCRGDSEAGAVEIDYVHPSIHPSRRKQQGSL
jgi:hypothetical protein